MNPCSKWAARRLRNIGVIGNVEYVQGNAEALPSPDNTFDHHFVWSANVTDKDKALRSMWPRAETRRPPAGA